MTIVAACMQVWEEFCVSDFNSDHYEKWPVFLKNTSPDPDPAFILNADFDPDRKKKSNILLLCSNLLTNYIKWD